MAALVTYNTHVSVAN